MRKDICLCFPGHLDFSLSKPSPTHISQLPSKIKKKRSIRELMQILGWGVSESRPFLLLVWKRPGTKLVARLTFSPRPPWWWPLVSLTAPAPTKCQPPVHFPALPFLLAMLPLVYTSEGYRIWNGSNQAPWVKSHCLNPL